MATFMQLLSANKKAGVNKRKNLDYVEFQMHKCRNLVRLKEKLENHTLQPCAKAYVVYKPVVREVFAASIEMCIVHHRLQEYLRPLMEEKLNKCVFNNRIGMGLERALQKIYDDIFEVSNGYTEDCWLIVNDIQGYFPNAMQERSYHILSELLINSGLDDNLPEELIYALRLSIFFNPQRAERMSGLEEWQNVKPGKSLFDKEPGIGAAPGELIMQLAMTAYHDEVIKWLEQCGVRPTVYGDDILMVVKDKDRVLRYIMPEFRQRMKNIGCVLHPKKLYCQHYTKGVRFCSQWIKIDRIYCGNRTIYNFKQKVRKWNRLHGEKNILNALSSLNSYTGFLKHKSEFGNLCLISDMLSDVWKKRIIFNKEERVFQLMPEYSHREVMIRRFKIQTIKKKKQ